MTNITNVNENMVQNIMDVFNAATPGEIQEGANWYQSAYSIAESLASTYGMPMGKIAGIMAALSPLNSWGHNVNLTVEFLQSSGEKSTGYLKAQLSKAREIYNLHSIAYPDGRILEILGGNKTQNFYRSIQSAGEAGITVDRHAYQIAINTRLEDGKMPTLTGKRYVEVAEAYRVAAIRLSDMHEVEFTGAQVQSVTWTLWRRKFWAVGAYDKHQEV